MVVRKFTITNKDFTLLVNKLNIKLNKRLNLVRLGILKIKGFKMFKPIYKKHINSSLVVLFVGRYKGIIIIAGNSRKYNEFVYDLIDYKDADVWEDYIEPKPTEDLWLWREFYLGVWKQLAYYYTEKNAQPNWVKIENTKITVEV